MKKKQRDSDLKQKKKHCWRKKEDYRKKRKSKNKTNMNE